MVGHSVILMSYSLRVTAITHSQDDNIGDINPFRYRGYYWDEDIQMYYLKTRYYDPQTGRFINMDEIEMLDESMDMIGGLNLYAYCAGGNPVTHIDPDGRLIITGTLIAKAAIIIGKIAIKAALKALKTSIIMGAVGFIIGGISGVVSGEGFWSGALAGLLTGLKWGAIMGGAIATGGILFKGLGIGLKAAGKGIKKLSAKIKATKAAKKEMSKFIISFQTSIRCFRHSFSKL